MAEVITVQSKEEASKLRVQLGRGQLPANVNGIAKWSRFVQLIPKENPKEWVASAQPFVTRRLSDAERTRRAKSLEEHRMKRAKVKSERNQQKQKELEDKKRKADERVKKLEQKLSELKHK